jgi:hypothetical protein
MWKWIQVLLAGVAVSFFFFPFEFTFLPGVNTKMAMAGVGLVLYVLDLSKGRASQIMKDGFVIAVLAALVSLCGLASVILNGTNDYTYATYIVSMFVWLGGAYTAIKVVRLVHGYVSVELVCNYLIGVCVGQCIIALMIDWIPAVKIFVDRYVVGFDFVDLEMFSRAKRLYGIGAGLDVAGSRFAAILVMIAMMAQNLSKTRYEKYIWLYLIAFILISVVGNMIARTTTVGILVAVAYWIYSLVKNDESRGKLRLWKYLILILVIFIPVITYLYSVDYNFQNNIRFAFEGFFSMAEKGYWETNSNNILKNMIVFPDNFKTWVIGDGYIENPTGRDPYYVGPAYGGYYMGTDIGYLRFIFYFGMIGLSMFILYFYKVAKACITRFPKYTTMFWLVLAINMIVWLKVSTDIFLVFAIFLCISKEENDAYEKQYEDSLPDPLDV